jgi:beta-glucanase (GH16 family)
VLSGQSARRRGRRVLAAAAALFVVCLATAGCATDLEATTARLPATSAVASTTTTTVPEELPGGLRLVFDASFTGHSLDTALWRTCYDYDACRISTNEEFEWYQASSDTVSSGLLSLTARAQPTNGQPFSSGMIQSNGRFDFMYGYVEVKAKIPPGYGTWPALWLLPAGGGWPPELDIMEYWGWSPGQIRESLFLPGDPLGIHHIVDVPDVAEGFHTFAVDWEPGVISWYVDHRLEFQLRENLHTLMYPIANLAVSAPPSILTRRTFPASFQIAYIRVYQHPGVGTHVCTADCVRG